MRPAPERRAALYLCVSTICQRYPGASVTSWWRSALHNKQVGGQVKSLHRQGLAMDVHFDASPPDEESIRAICRIDGVTLRREKDHDHIEAPS